MIIPKVLIVDDEPDIRELLALTLRRMDVEVACAGTLAEAHRALDAGRFDLCLTDMRLPDGEGITLVEEVQRRMAALPIAVITAHGNVEMAVHTLKAGAFDFITKPIDLQVLRNLVTSALRLAGDFPDHDRRSREVLLGDSAVMRATRATILKLARSQAPVHVSGESGTGKELVVRLIHEKGPRADKPFVPVNCGAIPPDLMESELFGHKKGSFTSASADKEGLFQAADGGTLFLDEVAELPLHMQVKLLRVIQEKCVRPVGSAREVTVDARIVSATHKDLATLVQQGGFRQDLYYRINVIELKVPPLRDRREDVQLLAEHILAKLGRQNGGGRPLLNPAALAALTRYHFPGNVRELENILERAMTLCENNVIMPADLQLPDRDTGAEPTFMPAADDAANTDVDADLPEGVDGSSKELVSYLDNVEREALLKALRQARNNKSAAARLLGITLRALRYRMNRLGLE